MLPALFGESYSKKLERKAKNLLPLFVTVKLKERGAFPALFRGFGVIRGYTL